MKNNLIFSFLILTMSLFIYSCQSECDCKKDDVVTFDTDDTIPVGTYNAWKRAWENQGQAYTDSVLTKYFTMPLIDLTEFNSNGQAHVAARFVLGLDTTIIPFVPHIMLVGVDSLGISMVPPHSSSGLIYDVTVPCPDACGQRSIQ